MMKDFDYIMCENMLDFGELELLKQSIELINGADSSVVDSSNFDI